MTDLMPGAEPMSEEGGPVGVLVLHGFTGNPQSMRPLADAFASAGFGVETPLLAGHGTVIEDMIPTGWAEWSADADAAYQRLAERSEKVVVAGLSMGGSLTLWLAERHPDIAAVICINPAIVAPEGAAELLEAAIAEGQEIMDGIGSDVADPDSPESAYDGTPLRPLRSMLAALDGVRAGLGSVSVPLLLFTSPEDHVVAPTDSDVVAQGVAGPVERVSCDRSYHVATIDYDKDLIIERSLEFVRRVTESS